MKILILISFLFSTNLYAFKAKPLRANKRIISCLPTNASTTGTSTSLDFAKTFSPCSGFACNSGFKISGSTCILAPVYNVVCATATVLGRNCTSPENFGLSSTDYSTVVWNGQTYNYVESYTYDTKLNCPANLLTGFTKGTSMYLSGTGSTTTITIVSIPVYLHNVGYDYYVMKSDLTNSGCTIVN